MKGLIALEIAGLFAVIYAVRLHSREFTQIYNPADVDPYSDIQAENGKWSRDLTANVESPA